MLNALKEYGVPLKYCRLVRAIYDSAKVRVRLQEINGHKSYSRPISIKRGFIQGDIPSAICFIIALDKLLKDHGNPQFGIQLLPTLKLSDIKYADDAALPDNDVATSSWRVTHFSENAKEEAGMEISIPKTKGQHIMHNPKLPSTNEHDIAELDLKFKYKCGDCDMTYPSQHGLSIHQARFCKKSKTAKKPNRRGTVADRIVKQIKTEKQQNSYPKVKISGEEIDNVHTFVYLGSAVANDGNPETPLSHRCNIAWGRFGSYSKTLMAAKLPIPARIRLYRSLVVTTMAHCCESWLFTDQMKQKINGVNSKMLAMITKKTIHHEAKNPIFDTVSYIRKLR